MNLKKIFYFLISFLFLLFLYSQDKTTITDIIENPDQYDGRFVEFVGTVDHIQNKISRGGNPYTLLTITDEIYSINVFSFGTLKFTRGSLVRVRGVFSKVKQVGKYTFYNEIDDTKGSVIREKVK